MVDTAKPTKRETWYRATRPRVFVASFVPMGIAAMIAIQDGVFHPVFFVLALIGVMFLQTAANLVNEYADFQRGADELKEAGQGMAIKKYGLSPAEIRNGAMFSVLAGSLIGLFLLSQSGPLLWGIGIGGVLVAITYTAGPFPLAYNGLGEVAAGIFMGPMIVLGAYYAMQPDIDNAKILELCIISFPVMFMTAAILHANNIRDMDADRSVNKRTLAVRFGIRGARIEYMFLIVATYVSQLVLVLPGWMPLTTLISFVTIPVALRLIQVVNTETDTAKLHAAQGGTAKLHGQIGLLIVIGWAVWLIAQALIGG